MFRHDRRELERLAAQLEAERARVGRSRERLGRAGRHVFDSPAALLAPFTLGALVGAAALHRKPRKGGRFSVRELLAGATALTGLVELCRDQVLPLIVEVRAGKGVADGGDDTGTERAPPA